MHACISFPFLLYHQKKVLCFLYFRLWGAFNVVLYNTVVFLMVISHLRAVLSDPGIVPLPKNSLDFSDMHSGNKKNDKVRSYIIFLPTTLCEKRNL